jgi:hypothetical protein
LKDSRQEFVLARKDAQAKRLCVVVLADGHHGLRNDRAGVCPDVDEMHGASSDSHAVLEGLMLRVDAREGGQKSWVHIDDAHRKRFEHPWGQQAHEPRKNDQVDAASAEDFDDRRVERKPVCVLAVLDHRRSDSGGSCPV